MSVSNKTMITEAMRWQHWCQSMHQENVPGSILHNKSIITVLRDAAKQTINAGIDGYLFCFPDGSEYMVTRCIDRAN